MLLSPSSSPPSGNKTPQQRSVVQPPINGIIQKPQMPEVFDGSERNGKFSVSSLLHSKLENMKKESVDDIQLPPAVVQRYNMQMHPKSRNVVMPTGPGLPSGIIPNPGVLPYFTPGMRLPPNPVPDGGMQTTHQFFLKQGPSKCESCNIVFCKYENFLAHKKHYCASRPPQNDIDDADKTSPEGSPGPKPLTVTSPQSSKDSVSPTPTLKPPMIQFICSTCGVKFSSFDNLTTHQSFYCPNRIAGPQDQADKSSLHLKACPKCKMSVVEGSHHQCQAPNCWKCPVCGAVCTTASAAQKHLDNHNGIRAFMCTICQYKGNTLRGLRTHIRMHFNKRLIPDLMEEDYVSCVIDENSVSSTADAGAKTPDEKLPLPPHQVNVKVTGGRGGGDDEPPMRELVIVKQEPSNGSATGASPDVPENPYDPGVSGGHPEPEVQPAAAADRPPSVVGGNNRQMMTTKYCKACDISFNYLSTFIAHKKYYCRNSAEYKCKAENAKAATVT